MMRIIRPLATIIAFSVFLSSCDRRGSLDSRQRSTASFSVEMTLIKNLSTGMNQVEAYFERDGIAFSDAIIKVGGVDVPVMGGGLYYMESSTFPLPAGLNTITFDSPDDDYTEEAFIDMPGAFGITLVNPQYNQNADDVIVEWSASDGATNYILAVSTLSSPSDGTVPLRTILPESPARFVVPDTTFEDFAGDPVVGIYYIYLIAYNEGFGPYSGIRFNVPEGLPDRIITDPYGILHYGTVAALDSIIVPF
jgi:hypothetical protein